MPLPLLGRVGSRPRAGAQERARRKLYANVSERDLQRQIIGTVQQMGDLVFHDPDARPCRHCGQMQHDKRVKGFTDLVILRWPKVGRRAPWVLFVELKTESGALSTEQRAWGACLSVIARVCPGVRYAVWRPSDLPRIVALLTDQGQDQAQEEPDHDHDDDSRHAA